MQRVANRAKFKAITGTRDLLPPETALWNHVELTAHEVFGTFGFGEIRTPVLEETNLFARSIGLNTDVVSKEMYTFQDHDLGWMDAIRSRIVQDASRVADWPVIDQAALSNLVTALNQFLAAAKDQWGRSTLPKTPSNAIILIRLEGCLNFFAGINESTLLGEIRSLVQNLRDYLDGFELGVLASLRPEATASVCRAYIEHGMQQWPQPVKLYYMGPMFRRERPQKGRYRQFYQIGAEILGGPDAPAIDAELIEMLMTFFDRLGLEGTELSINSIGHAADNCRRGYVEKLRAELIKVKDKLGPDSQRRIDTNPLRVLDSKLEAEQGIIAQLPRIADNLCDECRTHYAAVKHELDLRGVKYQENWRLVRGLDYYMRTTFEITARGLGSQNAVCGGGRYDGLIELLGGPPAKGIGFAIGEDRLVLSLQESFKLKEVASGEWRVASKTVYVAWMGESTRATAIRAAQALRKAGVRVELPPTEQKFGKALGQADKLGANYALILGENEVQSGEWTLKTLADGTQQKFTEVALLEYLRGTASTR